MSKVYLHWWRTITKKENMRWNHTCNVISTVGCVKCLGVHYSSEKNCIVNQCATDERLRNLIQTHVGKKTERDAHAHFNQSEWFRWTRCGTDRMEEWSRQTNWCISKLINHVIVHHWSSSFGQTNDGFFSSLNSRNRWLVWDESKRKKMSKHWRIESLGIDVK